MHIDLDNIIPWLAGLVAGLIGFLGRRAIKTVDDKADDHEGRIRKLEDTTANLMTAPQVIALYQEQREDYRIKMTEMREDQREFKRELSDKMNTQTEMITRIYEHIAKRQKNEREGD